MDILWLENQPLSKSMAFAAKEREKGGRVTGEREGESKRVHQREQERVKELETLGGGEL